MKTEKQFFFHELLRKECLSPYKNKGVKIKLHILMGVTVTDKQTS